MELRNMENITKTREVLNQMRFCCLEVAHGCEDIARGCETAQSQDFSQAELEMMANALFELYRLAEGLLRKTLEGEAQAPLVEPAREPERTESMKIDSEKDHDGDTQPANDAPEQPHGPLTEPEWMREPATCQCGHGRDVHGPAGPATPDEGLVCYMIDCPCRKFAAASAAS
jgi:hypothetical protein